MSGTAKKKTRTPFGATAPPFIDYLKDILRRYPDGGQILKELIQNADDASATEVVFIHDNRSYGTENLSAQDLAKYQGPALYAYNNAEFTDEDWEGIQSVARSVKRGDPNKVGRFGLGFNSVYHITDVTSIFSAGCLGMMDPQEKIFGTKSGGFLWSLNDDEDREVLTNRHDQFQPFRDIVSLVSGQEWSKVIQEDQNFKGTLFRFPLRTEASEISDNLYNSEKVVELFDSFIADADLSLLFLKNVSSVSLIHIDVHGSDTTRLEVKSNISQDVKIESSDSVIEGSTRIKSVSLKSKVLKETKWLITSCTMKEGVVDKLDSLAEKLKFVPRVDLAFPCDDNIDGSKSRLCCFLPLPNNESNKTGLPVYVNAYFGLTDNRRHIKWQEEDQKNDEHAIWNELLIKEVLPKTYLTIIRDAIKLVQDKVLPVSSSYNLWPDISQVQHKEKWHDVALDVLKQLFSQNIPVLSLAKDERQFITLSEAVFPCNGPTTSDTLEAIKRTLVSCGENLVTLSDSVAGALKAAYSDFSALTHVTPTFLRNLLHTNGVQNISKADRLTLLEFVLSDGQYSELQGLQLLPVRDGSFKFFTNKEEDTVLIDSKEFPRTLLPFCKKLFIQEGISLECVTHLRQLAGKNLYMVINIDANQVVKYTRSHMPEEWKKTQNGLVKWEVSSGQQPPLNWLQEFWSFLNNHFKELSSFTGLPLIPVNTVATSQPVKLARIQRNTTLIFKKSKQESLSEHIAQLINQVGGTVVSENNWLRHEDLDSFVLSPSPRHVLQVFVNLPSQQVIRELRSVSKCDLEKLKEYLSHLDFLSSCERDLLLKLPLFQTMKGEYHSTQCKQAVLFISGLTIPTDLPMPDSVVKCATEADRRLLQLLNISLLETAQAASLLTDSVESRTCSKAGREQIMTWILQHGNILFSQNTSLKHRCTNLSFIEINGVLKKPSSLFDPRVNDFKVIFEDDWFPPALYTKSPQMLTSLTDLGLINKEVDLSPEHLLHVASLIEKLTRSNPKESKKKAQVLLKLLHVNDLLESFTDDHLVQLKKLKWVSWTKPDTDKHSDSIKSGFYCPEEMRHIMYEDIVGYVMPLEGKVCENVCNKLSLKRPPPPEKVVENLSVLVSKIKTMNNPNTNADFKRKLRSIYGHIQKSIFEFTTLLSKDTPWLWNHNQFVSPKELVLEYPCNLDLSSHIGKVPDEFLPYKTLFLEFGLREELTDKEIVELLNTIKQTIESREQAVATFSEIKVSIEILNWLYREKKNVHNDIPVPVIIKHGQYTLKPKSVTVFCDLSKNGLKELECSQDEIHVVHEEIPIATAEYLDIQLLSTFILDPKSVGIEQCGQTEPITTRIKNILKEYDEESDIFKEIIQNAEDAGAQTCKFLMDFRVHKDDPQSLIDPDMELCQGPCVWAFNNEQFSQNDWDNIVRVGAASKENQAEKIGKFGLGFNTVYHVTDIPSILSGSALLILDPNISHIKKRIKHKSNPGIKLDLSQKRLFHWFPGQFGPYEGIFNCTFSSQTPQQYPGTLIKLPFRTEAEARLSEISSKVYYHQDILNFQRHLTKDSQSYLMFLKNINTVSLQTVPNIASTPLKDGETEDIFTVSKTTICTMSVPKDNLSMQQSAEKLLMQLNGNCKEVINCSKVDIVEITCEQAGKTQVQCWLIYNCFGTNQSLKMAMEKNKKVSFSLPVGGVAVPLQYNPESETFVASQTNFADQAFCFLPLSIHTGLPVNVNGTFAVTSNRKGLWESGVKHEWNKALLQDPLVTAYVTALLVLKKMCENEELKDYFYHTFWPDRDQVSETFKPLVDAFYCTLAQASTGPELFSDGERWCSLENAIFFDENIEEDQNICALAMQVCQKHVNSSHVVPLPGWVRNSFKQAGLGKVLQEKIWNWEKFYQEAVFPNLGQIDPKWRDTLMLHAIDLNVKEIDSLLISCPCIPTTSGQLQYIGNLVNPSGTVACLFEHEEGRLLGGTKSDFCSPERLLRLQVLGMANDMLSLEDITKKAQSICKIWNQDQTKAYVHIKCLLELLKYHMFEEVSPHWQTLRATQFLPAFTAGDAKMEKEVVLQRPAGIFTEKCALLVNMTQSVLDLSKLKIHSSDMVLQKLGVNSSPGYDMVLKQLKEAQKHCQSMDKSVVHKMAAECYRFLDRCLCDSHENSTDFILQCTKSFPFILVGDRFVNVNCVAERAQFEAKPYLHVLPHIFSNFRTLWEKVGVTKEFTINQCLNVLRELQSKHRNTPLPKTDLSVCLTILTKGIYESEKKTKDCLVPNKEGVLQPAEKLFYNDSPWMPVTKGVTLCHENISRVVALHLGIKTTRHHSLKNHVVENLSPFAFQFEQQEQLTVRIRNIISAYPAKKDILKELIQNADDAEATEINFVWDKRHHYCNRTFGEKWNHLQGPALCVFNNKVFSDSDLIGIQQLGEGGKHDSPGKTGKYGLGFNSVYHLTDCPSILTGDKLLCISDPNQNYVESTSDVPPAGIGYTLADTFKQMYMDVYKSFLPDKFPLKEGTMFRLPLRTDTMAENSRISQQSVTNKDMNELCSALSEDPEGLILFLKSICKIQVHEIDSSGNLKLIFAVEKNVQNSGIQNKDAFVKSKQHALLLEEQVKHQQVIYGTVISTSQKRQTKWIIAEQFGSIENRDNKQTAKLAQAAIAARVRVKDPDKEQKTQFQGAAFCSLPLPGCTGLPVHVNANFEVDSSRRSLWKEDGQSEKINWNESLKQSVIAPLYAHLLEHLRCCLTDKKDSKRNIEKCLQFYMCFFPNVNEHVNQLWHEMINEVYRTIKKRGLNLIPVWKSLVKTTRDRPLKEYFFDWCNILEKDPTEVPYLAYEINETITNILEDVGMKLVPSCMQTIWRSFDSAGIKLSSVNPSTVQTFLRAKPLNDPSQTEEQLPLPVTETLIKNEKRCSELLSLCLKDLQVPKEKEMINPGLIHGLPLLLTKDNVLRCFDSNSPKLVSLYDRLFIGYEDQFAILTINNAHIIDKLEHFGFVNKLTVPNAAKYLKPLVQSYLQKCEVDLEIGHYIPNDEMLEWLKFLWKFIINQLHLSHDTKGLTLADVRQLYSECCILPVVSPELNNKKYLRTLKDMPSVVQFSSETDLSGILFKLGFMKLDAVFFREMYTGYSSHFQSELMNVNNKSSVLDQLYNIKMSLFSLLSSVEMNELQTFLNSGVTKAKNTQDYQRKFKSLPLFKTVNNGRVRIDGSEIFVLTVTEMMRFPDLLTLPDTTAIFLINSLENTHLCQTLNIPTLSDLDYFVQFILPVVHKLTEHQILNCLKFLLSVRYYPNYSTCKNSIISTFKNVKIIRSALGKLEMASYFFDDDVEVFRVMLPKESFVPQAFWDELCRMNSKSLLIELGMKHDVSSEDITTFAHQVERETKERGQLEDLKKKSSLVFREALKFIENNKSKGIKLIQSIANVKFIFPVKIKTQLCNYHQPFATDSTAVPLRGALIEGEEKHQELIWSSVPIIHLRVYKSKNLQQMLISAGAFKKPSTDHVIKNIRNICQSPCQNEKTIQTRAQVFETCYAFLQTNDFKSHSLTGLPVVLVEKNKKLLKIEDVSFNLDYDQELRPYLYRIPSELVIYKDFFTKIGVKTEPTAAQFCNVLAAVHDETCDKKDLNPNQIKTVKRAVQQLFNLVKQGKQCPDEKSLYLFGKNGKLMDSCRLYYNDTHFEMARLEPALPEKCVLLEKLSSCHLGPDVFKHHKLLKLLPQKLQPQMLSQITEERVVETQIALCDRNCPFSGFFSEQLCSSHFRHGLICLIRDQSRGQITQEEAMEMWNNTFGKIQIICCESLQTELWLDKQQLPNTTREIEVYVKQGTQGCIFYLRHNEDGDEADRRDVCDKLADEIDHLLGNRLRQRYVMVLSKLLICESLEKVQKILAKNTIRDSVESESLLFNPPTPGTEIPEEWHDALDMSILNNFEEGEYVGYYCNGKYIFAVIVEELSGHSAQLTQRFKIDIGQKEPVEVGFLDLFQFKREKQSPPSSCWDLQLVEGVVPEASRQSTRSSPASLEEAKKEIDKCLDDIWTLPQDERQKAIKRLYLRWHPDKNPDCPLIATEAFKYLQNRIDDLTKGKKKSTGSHSSPSHSQGHSNFSDFFHEWNEEARHHRTSRERFYSRHRSYNFWTFNENIPKPDKEEARRWSRQARCDLNAASNDTERGSTEWCLFKVHQAVKKALIAAYYRNNGKRPNSSSILAMALKVSSFSPDLRSLPQLVRDLTALDVDAKKTQYPNYHLFPNIPNEHFKTANGRRAVDKASEVLTQVEAYVNN